MTSPKSQKVEIFYYSFNKEQEVKALIIKLFNNIVTKEEFKNYYMKIYEMDIPPNINIENEKSMHTYCETINHLFNCDENPLCKPELQKQIYENKLHTSMSVGDIIKINDHYFGVSSFGFKKLTF
jgi:hypothetical protein